MDQKPVGRPVILKTPARFRQARDFYGGLLRKGVLMLDVHAPRSQILIANPRGSRYQMIKDLGPKSHNNHGLKALLP